MSFPASVIADALAGLHGTVPVRYRWERRTLAGQFRDSLTAAGAIVADARPRLDLDNDRAVLRSLRGIELLATRLEDLPGGAFDPTVDNIAVVEERLVSATRVIERLAAATLLGMAPSLYYPLGEASGDAVDHSGNGNNGTVTLADGTRSSWQLDDGGDGSLTLLNGTRVSRANVAAIENIWDGGGCAVFLYRPAVASIQRLLYKGWGINNINGALQFFAPFSTTAGNWNATATTFVAGRTYAVAAFYDADDTANTPTVYVYDLTTGTLATLTVGSGLTATTSPAGTRTSDAGFGALEIGFDPFGGNHANGVLDEVALFNGTQPTEAQIDRYAALARLRETETVTDSEWVEFPQGVYRLQIGDTRYGTDGEPVVECDAADLSVLLTESGPASTYIAAASTDYRTAVTDVLDPLGLAHNLAPVDAVLPVEQRWPAYPETTWWEVVHDLADGINYRTPWPNPVGRFVWAPKDVDPSQAVAAVTYRDTEEPRLVEGETPYRRRQAAATLDNRAVALVDNPFHPDFPFRAVRENADPSSPVSTVHRPVREHVARWDSTPTSTRAVLDDATAVLIAETHLRAQAMQYQTATLTTFADPRRVAHEYYRLHLSSVEDRTLWRVRAWSRPLWSGGTMTHELQRVEAVALTDPDEEEGS